MFSQRFAIPVLALALGTGAASASVIASYSDPTTFNNATGTLYSFTNITFESDTCTLCEPLVDSGVTFDGGFQGLNVGPVSGWASGNVLKRSTGAGSISAALPNNIYALGVFVVSVAAPFPEPLDITFTSGTNYDFSLSSAGSPGSAIFFGVTTDAPISNLVFATTQNKLTLGLDNVDIGTQTAEAGPFILIGSGLVLLRLLRRRRPVAAAA